MNTVSKILLGALVLAVLACLWYVLTRKNHGGSCSGSCVSCGQPCESKKKEE